MIVIRTIAAAIAALAFAWAATLMAIGGFDARILGFAVRTHDPVRPLWVSLAALVSFVLAGGRSSVPPMVAALVEFVRRHSAWAAGGLAAATFVAGLSFATMAVGGSDSYGYVSQADLWLSGHLRVSQAWAAEAPWPAASWTFAPLAYRPAGEAAPWDIVPTYSPGLPLLMAAAKAVGGARAVFVVVPLIGAMMVLATFGIGRRLGSAGLGLAAATLVATSPVFLFMLMLPMSDVAASGLWASSIFFVLGPRVRSAATAGVLASAAVLVRPNLFPLTGVLALWLLWRAWSATPGLRRTAWRQLVAFGTCGSLGIAGTAAINQWVYGSPGTSGYGRFTDMFSTSNVGPNLVAYGRWFVDSQSWIAGVGLLALVVPLPRWWPTVRDRSIIVMFGLFVVAVLAEYFAFIQLDTWWTLRLLLPCWPLIMVGLASGALAAVRSGRPVLVLAGAGLVAVLAIRGLVYAADHDSFRSWMQDHRYPAAALLTRGRTDDTAIVFSLMHSGSLRYYGGRMTVRFDLLDPAWLDRSLSWFAARGAHPFALLEEWELEEMKRRFAGQRALAAFDAPPVFVYRQSQKTYLFDLLKPADSTIPSTMIVETFTGPRFVPPAPPPAIVFKD